MREWCSCGAASHTLSNRRLNAWRKEHRHETAAEEEPQKTGSSSQVEKSYQEEPIELRLGFQRE